MAEDQVLTETAPETSTSAAPAATPAPAPKTFREHYEAAKAAQSQDQDADSATDDTDATPPAEDTPTEDQPKETVEPEDTLLTADEVAKLNPKERSLYEKAQKNYTLKTQDLAKQRKELEQWTPLITALQDPSRVKETVQQLAERVGIVIPSTAATAPAAVVKQAQSELLADLPAEYQFLAPVLEPILNKLLANVSERLAPIQTSQNEIMTQAIANSTEATMEAFEQKYSGWSKHEPAMLAIMQKIDPKEMTDFEYMEMAYKLATFDIQSKADKVQQTKTIVDRMTKSAQAAERPTGGTNPDRVEHALPPPGKRTIKDAFEAAKRGERWVK